MNRLGWNDFVKLIDQQLKDKGIDPNAAIWYIDISYPQKETDDSRHKVPIVTTSESGLGIGE